LLLFFLRVLTDFFWVIKLTFEVKNVNNKYRKMAEVPDKSQMNVLINELENDLNSCQYKRAIATLNRELSARNAYVSDYVKIFSAYFIHVPVMYHHIRNVAKHSGATVVPLSDVENLMAAAIACIVRIVQDALACHHFFGDDITCNDVLLTIVSKFRTWIPTEDKTPLGPICDAVTKGMQIEKLPLPAWILSCKVPYVSLGFSTIDWGDVSVSKLTAARAISKVRLVKFRTEIADRTLSTLSSRTWGELDDVSFLSTLLLPAVPTQPRRRVAESGQKEEPECAKVDDVEKESKVDDKTKGFSLALPVKKKKKKELPTIFEG
jgi:hypothetical protein